MNTSSHFDQLRRIFRTYESTLSGYEPHIRESYSVYEAECRSQASEELNCLLAESQIELLERLKRADILAGLPAEATTVVLVGDIDAELRALRGSR